MFYICMYVYVSGESSRRAYLNKVDKGLHHCGVFAHVHCAKVHKQLACGPTEHKWLNVRRKPPYCQQRTQRTHQK